MKIVQRIGIILLLLVYIFGTTGLSVLHHVCNSSRRDIVTVYPEFFKNSDSSCCGDESTGGDCAIELDANTGVPFQHLDPVPCCRSISSFLKLETVTVRHEKLILNTVTVPQPLYNIPSEEDITFKQPLLQPAHFQFYSPPLFGKVLIHYLHQIKIPAHPSVAL